MMPSILKSVFNSYVVYSDAFGGKASSPSHEARPAPYNIQWGGRVPSRDMETGQVASRAVPVPVPMVEQGSRATMADLGVRAAMADQGSRAAMADQGGRAAMANQGSRAALAVQVTRVAMADKVIRAAMADQVIPWAMVGSPPQKNIGEVHNLRGALWRCGH